jgi:hypothetical protein
MGDAAKRVASVGFGRLRRWKEGLMAGTLSRARIGLRSRRAIAALVIGASVSVTVVAASTAADASTQPSVSGVSPP